MMVNIGTRVTPVNIALSSSRNAALFERKVLQYTTLCLKYHHCTLTEIKPQIFTMSAVVACVSKHCAHRKQHSIPDFLTKSIENTRQTCVDVANEYQQAYNTGADLENHLSCSLHQCNCAGFTLFLFAIDLSNKFSKIKSVFLNSIRSKQHPQP